MISELGPELNLVQCRQLKQPNGECFGDGPLGILKLRLMPGFDIRKKFIQ